MTPNAYIRNKPPVGVDYNFASLFLLKFQPAFTLIEFLDTKEAGLIDKYQQMHSLK